VKAGRKRRAVASRRDREPVIVKTSSEEGESNSGISQRSVKKLSKPMKAAAMSVNTPIDLRIPVDCFKLSVLSTIARIQETRAMTVKTRVF
jgi:hypothetical protein